MRTAQNCPNPVGQSHEWQFAPASQTAQAQNSAVTHSVSGRQWVIPRRAKRRHGVCRRYYARAILRRSKNREISRLTKEKSNITPWSAGRPLGPESSHKRTPQSGFRQKFATPQMVKKSQHFVPAVRRIISAISLHVLPTLTAYFRRSRGLHNTWRSLPATSLLTPPLT